MGRNSSFPLSLGATQAPLLVIDTTAPQTFVGIASGTRWLATHLSKNTALEALFDGLQACLDTAQLPSGLASIQACLYCEGPGSTLGLRIAHMAFQTWDALLPQPLKRIPYTSFSWIAHQCIQKGVSQAHILSEYKNGQWQYRTLKENTLGPLCTCTTEELEALKGPIYHLKRRLHWPDPPVAVTPADASPVLFYAPELS